MKEKVLKNATRNPAEKLKNAVKKLQPPQNKYVNILVNQYDVLVANKNLKDKNKQNIPKTNLPKIPNLNGIIKENNQHYANMAKEDKNHLFKNESNIPQKPNNFKNELQPQYHTKKDEPLKPIDEVMEAKQFAECAINELEFKKIDTAINFL